MDGETPAPRRTDPPEPAAGGAPGHAPGNAPTEQFGPLAVERHRKDDGRALLLYQLREPER